MDENHIFKYKNITLITDKVLQLSTINKIKVLLNWLNEVQNDLLFSKNDITINESKLYNIKTNIIIEINIIMLEDNIKFKQITFN